MKSAKYFIHLTGILTGVILVACFMTKAYASSKIGGQQEAFSIYLPLVERPSNPYSGLVYSTTDGLWMILSAGPAELLIDQPHGRISPDGQKIVYWFEEGDGAYEIWLADLLTDESYNLTEDNNRYERLAEWWPAKPGWILFASSADPFDSHASYGIPSAIDIQGENYQLLDDQSGSNPALSHDGQKIAYGLYNEFGVVNYWGIGVEVFDPAEYGLSVSKVYYPTWSPDDQKIAWNVAGDWGPGNSWRHAIAIFDLGTKSGYFIHEYEVLGGTSCGKQYHAWQPNGEWLATVTIAEKFPTAASNESTPQAPDANCSPTLWLLNTTNQDKQNIGQKTNPIWSPDGKSVAYTAIASDGMTSTGVWVLDTEMWEEIQILPAGAMVVDWIELASTNE